MDYTLTFDDLLDLDDSGDNDNFPKNQVESSVQPQQANSSCELQNDNNSRKRKQDFDTEISLKVPTEVIASNRDSTSHWMLGTLNPGNQCPKDTEYENRIPKLEDSRLYYDHSTAPYTANSQMPNLEANLENSNQKTEQETFGNSSQQRYEFQSTCPQRNEPHQENSQLIYGQSITTNILQPWNTSDLANDFPGFFSKDRKNALGYMENDPHAHYKKLEKMYASYAPDPSIMNPQSNKHVLNFGIEKIMQPSVSQHTAALDYGTRNEIAVDREVQWLGQNKHSSTDLVSETEKRDDNSSPYAISSRDSNSLDTMLGEIQRINDEKRIVQNDLQAKGGLNEVENPSHTSGQQKNAEQKNTQQKHAEKNTQKHAEKNTQQKHAEKNTQKNAEQKNREQKNTQQTHEEQKNTEQTHEERKNTQQKHAEQKKAENRAQEKHVDAKQENVNGNAGQKSAEKGAEKSAEQKGAEKSAEQKGAEKSAEKKTAKKSAEQENSEVFTGKGYDSWDDFIKALNDGKLYKR